MVQLQDKLKSDQDGNRKRHPLPSRLQKKLLEVEEDEIGQHLSSDEDSNDDNDDDSIYEPEPPAKSTIKNHLLDLHDLIDTGFNAVEGPATATLVDKEIDVVQDGLCWKLGGTLQPPLNVSKNETSRLKTGSAQHFTTPLSSFLSFVPLDFWKLWVYGI